MECNGKMQNSITESIDICNKKVNALVHEDTFKNSVEISLLYFEINLYKSFEQKINRMLYLETELISLT